jgi:multiple sugar transport system permease protein/raffinose/stachyose/melibiose transport system permease protein
MIAPALVLMTLFLIIPALLALVLSFTNARLISPNSPQFTGLDNYTRAFTHDPTFIRSLANTFGFALVVVPVQAALGLLLALLVNQRIRGVNVFRTIYFLPVVTSMVVVSIVWTFMYQENGLINSMLDRLTFGAFDAVAWLQDPSTAMPAIIILSIWQGVGFHMVIWLAGLQTIPAELYEAASLDGAGTWNKFAHVTWPGLRSTLVFVIVTITIAAFGLFVQVDVMTRGGPLESTTTIIFHTVRKGFREQEVGYGAALSLIFFVLVLTVSLVQRRLTREKA